MPKRSAFMLCTVVFAAMSLASQTSVLIDGDADGLDDKFEQALLERFRPAFMLSQSECDVAPAEFAADGTEPVPVQKNGTIYGQVFPHSSQGETSLIEIHYYHLWTRDCARLGHPLDAEHVSALVQAKSNAPASEYTALYWYAAAHENTVCDGSSGSRAVDLSAQNRGPMVWISAGKHGSFLTKECTGACGQDRCENASAMIAGKLINLGEPGRPLNDAAWSSSPSWPLLRKMRVEFTDEFLTELEKSDGIVALNDSSRAKKGVIRRAGMTADAIGTGQDHTEAAVATGTTATKSSLGSAARAVGRWFKRGTKRD